MCTARLLKEENATQEIWCRAAIVGFKISSVVFSLGNPSRLILFADSNVGILCIRRQRDTVQEQYLKRVGAGLTIKKLGVGRWRCRRWRFGSCCWRSDRCCGGNRSDYNRGWRLGWCSNWCNDNRGWRWGAASGRGCRTSSGSRAGRARGRGCG